MTTDLDRLLAETRITFTQLAQEQDVSVPTIWRFAGRGIRGHVLESFNLGVKRFTTREAFSRWMAAINGTPTNIPSFQVRQGDKVEVRETRRGREPFKIAKETLRNHQAPEWLAIDAANLAGTIADLPRRDQMPLDLNEQLVVEYYSR